MHSDLVVLGGGPGGYAAAFMAADLGMDVTVIEKDAKLGGVCLLRGCIPSKALLHVAAILHEARQMKDWGIDFGQPKIDLDAVRDRKEQVIATLAGGLKTLAKKRGIRVIGATGIIEDSQRIRLEGGDESARNGNNAITYNHLIIATGSRPIRPGPLGIDSDRVIDSSGALALEDIPEKLLVIGGGYIGLEMGTVYAELGSKVSVVEMMDRLLPAADSDLVRPLHRRLKTLFESIDLETKVTKLEDVGDAVEVTLEAGTETRTERYDRVLVSVGRKPNSGGIGLENTKVKVDDNGFIEVDERRRTADDAILAIGDVVGEPMLAHKAAHEGKVAVEALQGGPAVFDVRAIPAVVFTDPEIAWAGMTEADAEREGREVRISRYPWAASGRAQTMGRTEGMTKMIIDPDTERVLGMALVGIGAGELIGESVLAIETGCTVRDVTESIHPHPTISETVPQVGEAYFGLATEIYRPRRKEKSDG